jgi:hypothetical protein
MKWTWPCESRSFEVLVAYFEAIEQQLLTLPSKENSRPGETITLEISRPEV